MAPPAESTPVAWQPPSNSLLWQDGLWRSATVSPVSYPDVANEVCFQVEDGSYWFRHRMDCLLATFGHFPPAGTIYDIGGGNGFVALALQTAGREVALLEPGSGARNALRRGVRHVIQATLEDACFRGHSLPAAGAFDVIEHIADDAAFLRNIREQLIPGGRFYCTVPAAASLWSEADLQAGHYRRYSRRTLGATLAQAGFTVEFASYFFAWLTLPIAVLRALPSRLGLRNQAFAGNPAAIPAEHRLPTRFTGLVSRAQAWELDRLRTRRPLPFGTSLLCVARANDS